LRESLSARATCLKAPRDVSPRRFRFAAGGADSHASC
jgi:hypothetical protein